MDKNKLTTIFSLNSFESLELNSKLKSALKELNFDKLTNIQ